MTMGLQGDQILQRIDPGLDTGGDQAGQETGDIRAVRAGVEQTVLALTDEQL
jgi:hypothetical protein